MPRLRSSRRPTVRATLLKRDGDLCWLCGLRMNFEMHHNDPMAATIEHLVPSSARGGNRAGNLVLVHQVCNVLLDDLPIVEKIKMRDERRWLCQQL